MTQGSGEGRLVDNRTKRGAGTTGAKVSRPVVMLALGGVIAGLLWLKLRIVSGLPRTAYATPETLPMPPEPPKPAKPKQDETSADDVVRDGHRTADVIDTPMTDR